MFSLNWSNLIQCLVIGFYLHAYRCIGANRTYSYCPYTNERYKNIRLPRWDTSIRSSVYMKRILCKTERTLVEYKYVHVECGIISTSRSYGLFRCNYTTVFVFYTKMVSKYNYKCIYVRHTSRIQ